MLLPHHRAAGKDITAPPFTPSVKSLQPPLPPQVKEPSCEFSWMLLTALALHSQQSSSLESCSTASEATKVDIHLGSDFLWCTGYISALKLYECEGKKINKAL